MRRLKNLSKIGRRPPPKLLWRYDKKQRVLSAKTCPFYTIELGRRVAALLFCHRRRVSENFCENRSKMVALVTTKSPTMCTSVHLREKERAGSEGRTRQRAEAEVPHEIYASPCTMKCDGGERKLGHFEKSRLVKVV